MKVSAKDVIATGLVVVVVVAYVVFLAVGHVWSVDTVRGWRSWRWSGAS